nr:hypothetical protein [Thiosulfatihalobacter marinus]
MPDAHPVADILQLLRAAIRPFNCNPIPDLPIGFVGYANATRLRQRFYPGRDIHTISEDVIPFKNNVANMNTDPQPKTPVFGGVAVDLVQRPLDSDGRFDTGNCRCEFQQESVSHRFDDPATVTGGNGGNCFLVQSANGVDRAKLVHCHHARVSGDIGCDNCRQLSCKKI